MTAEKPVILSKAAITSQKTMEKDTIHNSKMKIYISHIKVYEENYQFNNLYPFLYFLSTS